MTTSNHSFLDYLPFPLLSPGQLEVKLPQGTKTTHHRPVIASNPLERRYRAAFESIVDLTDLGRPGTNQVDLFAHSHELHHIYRSFYHSAPEPNLLLRLATLHRAVLPLQLPLIRFSRASAGWAWGYCPAPEQIHLDFPRQRRVNPQSLKPHKILAHQVRRNFEQGSLSLGPVSLTDQLKTVLDLLQFETEELACHALKAFLADPTVAYTSDHTREIILSRPFFQNRERALHRLMRVTEEIRATLLL